MKTSATNSPTASPLTSPARRSTPCARDWQDRPGRRSPPRCFRTRTRSAASCSPRPRHLFRRRRPQGHHAAGQPADAPAVFREIEQTKKKLPHAGDAGQAGGQLHQRRRAGWRLGGGAGRSLPHRGRRPQDPARPARDHAGPDPRCHRHHQDDALAGPDGCPALHPGEPAVQSARRPGNGPGARAGADAAALRAALAWIAAHPQAAQPWDERTTGCPAAASSSPQIAQAWRWRRPCSRRTRAGCIRRRRPRWPPWSKGPGRLTTPPLRIESRYLAKLIVSPVARNMINTFFFNMNAIKSGQSRPAGVPRFKPARVGLLGAGMMGAGIAYAQASRGIATVLKDVTAWTRPTRARPTAPGSPSPASTRAA
jgi:hypothetical protein